MNPESNLSRDLASLRIQREPETERRGSWRGVVTVLVVALLLAGVYAGRDALVQKLLKPQVDVGAVTLVSPAQADVKLTAMGYVVPQRRATVAAKQVGQIKKLLVEEGQLVKEGQLLAQLDPDDAQAALQEARAAVATAQAQETGLEVGIADATLTLTRETKLLEVGGSIMATVDAAKTRLAQAEAALKAAKAATFSAQVRVERAELALRNTRIVAPFSGRVVKKLAETGEMPVSLTLGILELVDFDSLVVEADVSESKMAGLALGTPTEITLDAHPNQRYRGELREIRPTVDRQKATVMVRVKFVDPMDNVLPQMAARVLFLERALDLGKLQETPRRVIPKAAVVQRSGAPVAFVISEGTVRVTNLTLGAVMGSNLELLEGPPSGSKVVLNPPADLTDGTAIKEKIPHAVNKQTHAACGEFPWPNR